MIAEIHITFDINTDNIVRLNNFCQTNDIKLTNINCILKSENFKQDIIRKACPYFIFDKDKYDKKILELI